ncbi:Zinc ABC transporter, ATP-binding protein ZnuC [hydrothermal vent metagenome]|uniref:Zinc ABC transporter, ATP-binding protein ZnuC n=1 Tax=hydrothermal vent metagenome TaxID=652676 RepID=A0A1W1EL67_9ZZZZ
MKILEIKNLSFAYEKDIVLEDINLSINEKDFLAIIGPNGGGKSTLLKLILGLNSSRSGTIKIFNEKPSKNIENIGYVPQNTNINTAFPIRVIDVVLMGYSKTKFLNFGYSKKEKNIALDSLDKVGMKKYSNCKIGSLSGGERQRVMIARALSSNPKILILDEPTANIDVNGQKKIYELLKNLNKNITIIVVSHDISIILGYASKVAHINKSLTFHKLNNNSNIKTDDKHFCEVEMLEMLGSCSC